MYRGNKTQRATQFIRTLAILALGIGFLFLAGAPLAGAAYPEKEITIIVPGPPGAAPI